MFGPPPRCNQDNIKTNILRGVPLELLQEKFSCARNAPPLPKADRFCRINLGLAGLDFHKNQPVSIFCNQINFPHRRFETVMQDLIALQTQVIRRKTFGKFAPSPGTQAFFKAFVGVVGPKHKVLFYFFLFLV